MALAKFVREQRNPQSQNLYYIGIGLLMSFLFSITISPSQEYNMLDRVLSLAFVVFTAQHHYNDTTASIDPDDSGYEDDAYNYLKLSHSERATEPPRIVVEAATTPIYSRTVSGDGSNISSVVKTDFSGASACFGSPNLGMRISTHAIFVILKYVR